MKFLALRKPSRLLLLAAPLVALAGFAAEANGQSLTIAQTQDVWVEVLEPTALLITTDLGPGPVTDSMLWLYNPQGVLVAYNDDYQSLASRIAYNASAGLYRIRAGVCCGNPDQPFWQGTSPYQLTVNLEAWANAPTTTSSATTTTSTSTTTTSTTVPETTTTQSTTTVVDTTAVSTTVMQETTLPPEPISTTVEPTTTSQEPTTTTVPEPPTTLEPTTSSVEVRETVAPTTGPATTTTSQSASTTIAETTTTTTAQNATVSLTSTSVAPSTTSTELPPLRPVATSVSSLPPLRPVATTEPPPSTTTEPAIVVSPSDTPPPTTPEMTQPSVENPTNPTEGEPAPRSEQVGRSERISKKLGTTARTKISFGSISLNIEVTPEQRQTVIVASITSIVSSLTLSVGGSAQRRRIK